MSAGDVIIFNTWLPHETMNWASNSFSLNGALAHVPHTDHRNPFDLDLPLRCFRDDDDDDASETDVSESAPYAAPFPSQAASTGPRDEL